MPLRVRLLLVLSAFVLTGNAAAQTMHEVATTSDRPAAAARRSNVSRRLFRIRQDVSAERIIAAGRAFHITRGEWPYIQDADFIVRVKAEGWTFQGTVNRSVDDAELAARFNRHWRETPIAIEQAHRVSAWARGDAPVVVHLRTWDRASACRMRLRAASFLPGRELQVRIRRPVAYDAALHERCEQADDYEALSSDDALPVQRNGDWWTVDVPRFKPWVLLVIEAADN